VGLIEFGVMVEIGRDRSGLVEVAQDPAGFGRSYLDRS
jgi:hypothetical protein